MPVRARMQSSREEMDKVPLTLSLTMTIGEWRQVSNQLGAMPNAWPSCDVKFAILRAVQRTEQAFNFTVEEQKADD